MIRWVIFFFFFFLRNVVYLFIYFWLRWVFVSVQGISPVAASGGPLFIAVRGPPTIAAPPVAEHRLQTRRLSSCGSRAQLLRGMWDPPRPGLEPVSPAPAGRLPTTAPPGKPPDELFLIYIFCIENKTEICKYFIHLKKIIPLFVSIGTYF